MTVPHTNTNVSMVSMVLQSTGTSSLAIILYNQEGEHKTNYNIILYFLIYKQGITNVKTTTQFKCCRTGKWYTSAVGEGTVWLLGKQLESLVIIIKKKKAIKVHMQIESMFY